MWTARLAALQTLIGWLQAHVELWAQVGRKDETPAGHWTVPFLNSMTPHTKWNTLWVFECLFVSAPKKTRSCYWSFTLTVSCNCSQPHGCSNHNGPGSSSWCQLAAHSVFLWFFFPIVNHSVLTVAASLLLTPFWLVHVASNCTAWFSQICCDRTHRSWVFFRGEQSILGRGCCYPRDDHEGVWAFWLPQQLLCEQLWLLGQFLPSNRLSWTRAVYKKHFPHKDIITTSGTSQALWRGS